MQKFKKLAVVLLSAILFVSFSSLAVSAEEYDEYYDDYEEYDSDYYNYYDNLDTQYFCWVNDNADLFSDAEEMDLADRLYDLTEYGNAMIVTIDSNSDSAESFAREFLYENSGQYVSGTVFLIDMDNRMLYIFSDGAMYKTITKGRANTITDNVYKYASDSRYYDCAVQVIDQELTILEGGKIAQPMKYASNILLALILALMINYFIVIGTSSVGNASSSSIIQAARCKLDVGQSSSVYVSTSREYSPQSNSDSGSSGGGGGGSSGGGGGHSF